MFPLLNKQSQQCELSIADLPNEDIETICFLLYERTKFSHQRTLLRHHINHTQNMLLKIKLHHVVKKGIFKGRSYDEVRLYLLAKRCEYRDVSLKRSSFARKTTNKLRRLLKQHKLRVLFDADNRVRGLMSISGRCIILSASDIESFAKNYEFNKAIFGR